MADAQVLYETASTKAVTASGAVDRAQALYATAQQARLQATTAEMVAQTDKQVNTTAAALNKRTVAHDAAIAQQQAAERNLTGTVESESAKQHSAATSAFGAITASAKSMALSIAAAFGIVALVQQGAQAIKQAIVGYGELGHEVMHIADLMGTTTEKASLLDYTFKQFGLSSANVTQTIAQLTRHVIDNEAEFHALGVQTRDTNGELLSTYDIFDSMRQVMSNAADGTAKTADMLKLLARSGSAGGQALGELQQILGLTNDQMAAMEREAQANNAILTKSQALMGTDMVQAGRALGQAFDGLGRIVGAFTVGPLTGMLNGISTAIQMFELLASTAAASMASVQGIPILSGILNLVGNSADIVAGNQTDATRSIAAQMAQIESDRQALAGLGASDGTNQMPTFAPGGGGASQAIQDQKAALQAALERYNAEKQAAIDAITEEKTARDSAFNDQIAQTTDLETARKADHQAAIDAINEETQTLTDQYDLRKRASDDAITGLRAQITLLDQQFSIQSAQDQLAKDQQALANASAQGSPTIRKGEHLEDYYKRVHDYDAAQTAAKEKVATDQAKIALDAQKVILNGQIATLEAAAKADQRALEDKKKAAADEIKGIQQIQKAEETRTAKAIADIRGQIKEQDAQSAALIKGLQAEMKTEKERVDDEILQLDKLLKAQQGLASGTGAAWGSALGTIGTAADAAKQKIDDLHASLAALNRDNAPGGVAAQGAPQEGDVQNIPGMARMVFHNGEWHSDTISPDSGGGLDLPGAIVNLLNSLRGPKVAHAAGGSMVLSEPTALIGLNSGTYQGIAGEAGTETATFTPGSGAGGGGGRSVTINVIGLAVPDAVRLVAAEVARQQARADDAAASFGYTRR
jgi:hypothetical protein